MQSVHQSVKRGFAADERRQPAPLRRREARRDVGPTQHPTRQNGILLSFERQRLQSLGLVQLLHAVDRGLADQDGISTGQRAQPGGGVDGIANQVVAIHSRPLAREHQPRIESRVEASVKADRCLQPLFETVYRVVHLQGRFNRVLGVLLAGRRNAEDAECPVTAPLVDDAPVFARDPLDHVTHAAQQRRDFFGVTSFGQRGVVAQVRKQ